MRIVYCEQGTPEWHAARAGVCTASRFGEAIEITGGLDEKQAKYVQAVLDGAPEKEALALAGYKAKPTSETVAAALRGERVGRPSAASERYALELAVEQISGKPYGDTFQTYATKRGHEEEGFARAAYEARFRTFVDECGVALTDDGLFGYSTDGLVGTKGAIEVKVPVDLNKTWALINGEFPDEYIHQIQGGMWVMNREWVDLIIGFPDLACLKNGNEIYVRRIHRDDEFIAKMEPQLLAFMGRVAAYKARMLKPFQPELALAA